MVRVRDSFMYADGWSLRKHTRLHWLWVFVNERNCATAVLIVDDFGNLVNLRPGLHLGLLVE